MLKAIYGNTQETTYQHCIYQISSIQALHTSQNPYIQETRNKKNSYMISFYIQETSHAKWKENTA